MTNFEQLQLPQAIVIAALIIAIGLIFNGMER